MLGREVEGEVSFLNMGLSSIAVIAVVVIMALLRARKVKNYPPVIAFRKGIKTHSFRRNPFPLDKTKNINLRLALKGLIGDIKSNIGMAVCIITAGILMTFGVLTVDFFKNGTDGLVSLMAYDIHPIYVSLANGVDPAEFREELLKQEGVRKCLMTYGLDDVNVEGTEEVGNTVVYDDFASAKPMNEWISNKTLGLLKDMLQDTDIKDLDFALINALAIDMDWNEIFIKHPGAGVHEDYTQYNENFSWYAASSVKSSKFSNTKEITGMEIVASFNKS